MISSSASSGTPGMPRIPDTSPSFIAPPSASPRSSAWLAMIASNALAYSSARRISPESWTHFPSSEKKFTCAFEECISPISASFSPSRPAVIAPTGNTSTSPTARPMLNDLLDDGRRVRDRVGVRHRAQGAVNPPSAAGARTGLDRLGVLASRLAEVRVQVDERRRRPPAPCSRRPSRRFPAATSRPRRRDLSRSGRPASRPCRSQGRRAARP